MVFVLCLVVTLMMVIPSWAAAVGIEKILSARNDELLFKVFFIFATGVSAVAIFFKPQDGVSVVDTSSGYGLQKSQP